MKSFILNKQFLIIFNDYLAIIQTDFRINIHLLDDRHTEKVKQILINLFKGRNRFQTYHQSISIIQIQ